ncbi:hypothetical protein EW026_g7193 [Hermanssonia centrifuga]|uniref:Pentatricopeptide repeat-containing protein n=1 Tax=Hermanssonia centrifuga TaxID=98765 RepID=A0A4S4K8K9_9APHY|nr:hypothetical protein EW026_g7193 [Hermanssonia centrifuga]
MLKLTKRRAHSATQLRKPPPQYGALEQSYYAQKLRSANDKEKAAISPFSAPAPRSVLEELEDRVLALKESALLAVSQEDASYSEEELMAVYEDLLALPATESPDTQAQAQAVSEAEAQFISIVNAAASRLLQVDVSNTPEDSSHSMTNRLRQLRGAASQERPVPPQSLSSGPIHLALIARLEEMIVTLKSIQASVSPTNATENMLAAGETIVQPVVPTGVMTENEWSALVQYSVHTGDVLAAERVLDLTKQCGSAISEDMLNEVLAHHAAAADVDRTEHFVHKYLAESQTSRQRDLHIKAHVNATPSMEFPERALQLLHDYEVRGTPAPQRTYSRLITHLFSTRNATSHAHAWDLFSHMRYVAHPIPDAVMYTTMIRACASPALSYRGEPERALDLFTEMTVDRKIPATVGAYTAVILACARSGKKSFVQEAFRLAKEMLDSHRDARGASPFTPNRKLYCALLEGAKRLGDLSRVRWILAEMVKQSSSDDETATINEEMAVNEEVMLHVFHAYAAYKPPFKRSETRILDEQPKPVQDTNSAEKQSTSSQTSDSTIQGGPTQDQSVVENENNSFAQLPPQTHADVIREAKSLLAQILEDQNAPETDSSSGIAFQHVKLTSKLVNSYLSVHYAHSPVQVWRDLFQTLHRDLGVPRNAWSYADVLERCAHTKKGAERDMALHLAEEVWTEWEVVENAWRARQDNPVTQTVSARLIERVYAAMIRMLSVTGRLDAAVAHAKAFAYRYPPPVICEPPPKHPLRSTRMTLIAAKPIVRLTNASDVPDDAVPPLLSFSEVEVLHHRLVAANRVQDLKYLTWMCKAYENALRTRRERTLKATPAENSPDAQKQLKDNNPIRSAHT